MIIPYQTAQVSFKKQQRIGENGENSEVYVVHDKHLDAELVIKQVKTDGFNEERYLLEAQLLYKSVHPYVVQVLYACKDAQHIYIAMPYYRRGSLHQVVEAEGLTCRQLIRYSIQFLSGLNNIHSKGCSTSISSQTTSSSPIQTRLCYPTLDSRRTWMTMALQRLSSATASICRPKDR